VRPSLGPILRCLRRLALAACAVVAACACPKVTSSQFVIDEDLSQPPAGDYQLRGCFIRDARMPVECEYRDVRSGAVVIVATPAPPIPPCDDEDGDCPAPDAPAPTAWFEPSAFRGSCELLPRHGRDRVGTLACTYQGPRGATASYQRAELRDVRDGYDRYYCELDRAGTSLSCWHTRFENCHATLRRATAPRA